MLPTFRTLDYLYIHTSGAGNTGHATVITNKSRTYVFNLVAATANSFQFVENTQIKRIVISTKCAAAGGVEVSRVSTSQFANAGLATADVICRLEVEPVTTSGLPNETVVFDFT